MDYRYILKRSWEITKTSKVLWIFGMVVAAFSGGGLNFSGGGGGGGGGKEEFKFPTLPPSESLPKQTSQVLGATSNSIAQIFGKIPIWVWLILGVTILLAILVAIAVSLFIRNWGKGALVASIHDQEDQKSPSLKTGSKSGLAVVKRFIYLHIVPWFVWVIFAILLSFLAVGSIVFIKNLESEVLKIVILILCILIWILGLIVTWLFLNLSVILGEQLIVRQNLSAKEALKNGFSLTRKYFAEMLGMGAINMGIGCAFGCLTMLFLILLVIIAVIAFAISKTAGIVVGAIITIPLLACLLLSLLIRGIYTVFNTATWTLLAREIEQKEKQQT